MHRIAALALFLTVGLPVGLTAIWRLRKPVLADIDYDRNCVSDDQFESDITKYIVHDFEKDITKYSVQLTEWMQRSTGGEGSLLFALADADDATLQELHTAARQLTEILPALPVGARPGTTVDNSPLRENQTVEPVRLHLPPHVNLQLSALFREMKRNQVRGGSLLGRLQTWVADFSVPQVLHLRSQSRNVREALLLEEAAARVVSPTRVPHHVVWEKVRIVVSRLL